MSNTYIPVKAEDWVKMVEATKVAADLLVENERLVNLVAYLKQGKPFTKHEDDIRRGLRTK